MAASVIVISIKGTALIPNLGMALFAFCALCLPAELVKLWHLILGSALSMLSHVFLPGRKDSLILESDSPGLKSVFHPSLAV